MAAPVVGQERILSALRQAAIDRCVEQGCDGSEHLEEQPESCRKTFNDADYEKWCDRCLMSRVLLSLDAATEARDKYRQWYESLMATRMTEPESARDVALARAAAAEQKLSDEEAAHMQTLEERDNFHDAADKLAYAIASEDVIGEHSNLNDPWENALEQMEAMHAELSRLRAERTEYEQSVRPFLPGAGEGIWGRIKAFIVEGAPSRDEGIRLARDITRWQTKLPPGASQE